MSIQKRYERFLHTSEFLKNIPFVVLTFLFCFFSWPTLFAFTIYASHHRGALAMVPFDPLVILVNLGLLLAVERVRRQQGKARRVPIPILMVLAVFLQMNSVIFDSRLLAQCGLGILGRTPSVTVWSLEVLTLGVASAILLVVPET